MSLSIPGERNMQKIDFSKLLGFNTLSAETSATDFTDATVAAKLGAKVGAEILGSPTKGIDFQDATSAPSSARRWARLSRSTEATFRSSV